MFYRNMQKPPKQRWRHIMLRHSFPCDNTKTGSEIVQTQNYEALNAVHLMQTDTDLQPVEPCTL